VTKQLQVDRLLRSGRATAGDVFGVRAALCAIMVLAAISTPGAARETAETHSATLDATAHGALTAVEPPAAAASVSPLDAAPASVKSLDLSGYAPGTIVVETSERKLHLVLAGGEVRTYPVGVGKAGKSWSGVGYIRGKYIRPAWAPPKALKREKPNTPDYIPGGVPANPMGAAAMTLSVDQYAIHGTNAPSSIGTFASFGCIRMYNRDVLDLYKRVKVGTKVVVLK
jgi:lipoprotein-anchoring transpeptidase ErfK/SrfK